MNTITVTLSVDHANVIMKYLGNGTYVEVAPVVAEMQRQCAPQIAEHAAKAQAATAVVEGGQPVP